MKILLAIDGSPQSERAVTEVVRRPWPEGSHVKVVTVYNPPPPFTPEIWGMSSRDTYTIARGHLRKTAQAIVDKAYSLLSSEMDKSIQFTTEILEGDPKSSILEKAEHWGADLIVVGAKGHGAISRFLLGSVSSALVHHAKCSVEIIRERDSQ